MSKDFFRFDKEYSREEWTKYLGDNFKYEYGSIPNQNSIIEKYIDCLDDSNNDAIIWLGNLNVDEDIGVYEIRIKNTKTGSRVKISKICTDIIKSGNRNSFGKGIFFILYSNENEKAYRISYVKYDKKVNENLEVKKDLSDPKRFTYLLGERAKVKTAQSRLNKEAFSSVKKIEEAFSVEPVNEEFYKGIKELFDKICKDVLKNFVGNKSSENKEGEALASDCLLSAKEFSLRFLGRALFCWFLREKDLIPKEIFDFINIGEMKTKDNYYKEVLEELFFNILNVKMEERKIESKIINKYEKQIPFLNGGLFLKKEEDYKVKTIDNEIIKELFEFFEKYNFTVDESTPFDIEISIDPEMLGRIFENLLVAIDTNENLNIGNSTFYTPREIVDYMVKESVRLSIQNNTKNISEEEIEKIFNSNEDIKLGKKEIYELLSVLHKIKILDPACGSGAFPIGILQRTFMIIDKLDPNHEFYKELLLKNIKGQAKIEFEKLYESKKFDYAYKLYILQNMIHGVDIQPIAIEISKLRAFLSLIVEEEKNESEENLGIKPLPNLEFNFISANSLMPLEVKNNTQQSFNSMYVDGIIEKIKSISEDYFNASSEENKNNIKYRFEELRDFIVNNDYLEAEDKKKFLSWNPFENKSTDFFDSEIQFGTKFFDIVIGNPPYLEARSKIFSDSMKENYQNNILINFHKNKKLLGKGMDLSLYFYIKSLQLINENGFITFVCTNSWLSTKYGINFQKFLIEQNLNITLIDTDFKHFSTAAINTIISIFHYDNKTNLTLKYFRENFAKYNELYSYSIGDKNLMLNYKWNILFTEELDILLSILKKLSKGLTIDKIGLKYGQGLNGYKVSSKGNIHFYHKEKPSFTFTKSSNKIDNLKTKRTPPIFIMPRGIAYSHYCCFNKIHSYSDSYVEILKSDNSNNIKELKDKNLLSIWLFYNSTLGWFLREITGRNNLGGGLLKAEAFDLQNIPCVFDIDLKLATLIYNKTKNLNILTYDKEINTEHHKEIDKVIYDSIGLNKNEKEFINNKFINLIEQRKSK
ncbi:type II restriction endonuclease [Brachyspira aalborgi]|uniref:site-specific DNA-methyltransferase (adenine-specific) n=1 Tax=Brachyspira aalborgi TaxID=29522 RepID=A0A5C8D7K3_9SPIR|nr:DNA methyltransferase [Brachyspira aalborgi]TXJ21394.1 type II restriction endonuclease [Brachyspira aalborgi]